MNINDLEKKYETALLNIKEWTYIKIALEFLEIQ